MRRYVILGVNDNPTYQYYLPIVFWAWRAIEWEPMLFYSGNLNDKRMELIANTFERLHEDMTLEMKYLYSFKVYPVNVSGYRSATLAQVSRLYGSLTAGKPNSILMTSDCDMLPLSNYWNPSDLNVTCYGRDLTDYHYPICYCAMTATKWIDVMLYTDEDYNVCLEKDLNERPKNSNAWLWDQDILTERLNRYGKKLLTLIPRGTDKRTGYPIGRIDRSHWTLDHPKLIDAHLPHDILTNDASFHKVTELLRTVWPKEDFSWYYSYHKEFKKLL